MAQHAFKTYLQTCNQAETKEAAAYYIAYAALKMNQKDGPWLLRNFAEHAQSAEWQYKAYLNLGRYYFNQKKFDKAARYFDTIPQHTLTKSYFAEITFKKAYAYLMLQQTDLARDLFYKLRQDSGEYYQASVFYYAHIAYSQNQFSLARQLFKEIETNPSFKPLIPNYVFQMDYLDGAYEEVVKNGVQLLKDSAQIQSSEQLLRLMGESYFYLKNYTNAISSLSSAGDLQPPSRYMLAFSYYKLSQWDFARVQFEELINAFANDSVYRANVWYHLADCYVQLNQPLKARFAFSESVRLLADSVMIENAEFNYVKLSYLYKGQFQNDCEEVLKAYLKKYPNTLHALEVSKLLVNYYQKSKNYQQVINYLSSLPQTDAMQKNILQNALYSSACISFNNGATAEAEIKYKRSEELAADPELTALSVFWQGEIAYQRADYQTSVALWKRFFLTEGASSTPYYDEANYHLGYAYFKRNEPGDLKASNLEFRKYIESLKQIKPSSLQSNSPLAIKYHDALLRTADTYLLSKDIKGAAQFYEKALEMTYDRVYPLYQLAICYGVLKNNTKKIELLKQIETTYPKSEYYLPALIEIAETYYKGEEQYTNAIAYYKRIEERYPNTESERKSWIQLGNIYYNLKNDEMAFAYFDKYVQLDPSSEISKNLQDIIRKILEERQNVEYLESYFKALGNPLTEQQIENALYRQAFVLQEDTLKQAAAAEKWTLYIDKFSQGKFISEALYNRADFRYRSNQTSEALQDYLRIIQLKRSLYTEPALAKACYIRYKSNQVLEALPLYQKLDSLAELPQNILSARLGVMRCAFTSSLYAVSLEASKRVLLLEKTNASQQAEARFIKARSLYETASYEDALLEFTNIVKNVKNSSGAEAYYWIAKIYALRNDSKNVEKTTSRLIHFPYATDYWNQKGMLLLAETYFTSNDRMSAKIILESLISEQPPDEITLPAKELLKKITEQEQQPVDPPQQEPANELQLNETATE